MEERKAEDDMPPRGLSIHVVSCSLPPSVSRHLLKGEHFVLGINHHIHKNRGPGDYRAFNAVIG